MHKYKRLLPYARRQRRFFIRISGLTLAASALAALQPWPMKLLVDHVLGQKPLPAVLQSSFKIVSSTPSPTLLLAVVTVGGLVLFALNSSLEMVLIRDWTLAGRRMVY